MSDANNPRTTVAQLALRGGLTASSPSPRWLSLNGGALYLHEAWVQRGGRRAWQCIGSGKRGMSSEGKGGNRATMGFSESHFRPIHVAVRGETRFLGGS